METKDHDILIRLEEQVKNLTEKVSLLTDDHEGRIRSLEESRDQFKGASKATSILWSALTALALFLVEHFIFRK